MTLKCNDLSKNFGGIVAVDSVSASFEEGTIHGLIGPNGAGKTTFFDLLTGFQSPDGGTIVFNGSEITDMSIHKRAQAGLVRSFQDTRVFPGLTLLENLYAAADMDRGDLASNDPPKEIEDRAHELLQLVNMEDMKHNKANDISYGQQKLIDFTTILMRDPTYVLLDEPVAGINPSLINDIEEFIERVREGGTTPIIVEHNMEFAMRISETMRVMHQGRIIATGEPEEIQQDQQVLDAYLGG